MSVVALVLLAVACDPASSPPQVPPGPQGNGPGTPGQGNAGGGVGMANPASKHCIAKGGKLEIRADAKGNESGVCIFADGSSCDEWAFMDGKCAPGKR